VKTFSVGFDIPEFSELGYARKVAERYGTEHHEITVGFREFAEELPFLAWIYDETDGGTSGQSHVLMCREAKKHVSVMLCGEGPMSNSAAIPSTCSTSLHGSRLDTTGVRNVLLRGLASGLPFKGRRLRQHAEILAIADAPSRFRFVVWRLRHRAPDSRAFRHDAKRNRRRRAGPNVRRNRQCLRQQQRLDRFLYCDVHTRLVDDILVKSDRMSMGPASRRACLSSTTSWSSFAASLPQHLKVSGLSSKIVLKRLAERYMPHETIYRRKVGSRFP